LAKIFKAFAGKSMVTRAPLRRAWHGHPEMPGFVGLLELSKNGWNEFRQIIGDQAGSE
jgi:hypothetical protein